jgi:hypothetical protein
MKRAWLVVLLGVLAIGEPAPAQAQMADALGKPLPKSDLPTGTITVRVIAGDLSNAVVGADVTLVVDGKPRVARTNESGRATFADLAPGATVQASVAGEAKSVTTSDEIKIPASGGVAVMLSTKPFIEPTGPGAPMAPGQRPPPRQMAGKPRPEQGDAPGQVTVRLAFNDWDDTTGTTNRPVLMAALSADDRVGLKIVNTDAAGRATFTGLDTSGATAYYAMALLTRTGAEDRLLSDPIIPSEEAGVRVMLSGDKGTAPAVDDLGKVLPQPELPPGMVVAAFVGAPVDGAVAELYDLGQNKVVAQRELERSRALPSTIKATFGAIAPATDVPAGALRVKVTHAGGQRGPVPLEALAVHVRHITTPKPVAGQPPPVESFATIATGATDAAGLAQLTGLPAGATVELVVVVEGKPFTSPRFVVDKAAGASVEVSADWQVLGMFQAVFEGVDTTRETAYLVQTRMHDQLYRSSPIIMGSERGVAAPLYILPRIAVTFELDGHVDDEYFAFQGTFTVQNFGWSPYAGPSEGIRLPMPSGASGLVLADMDKAWVVAEPDAFRLTRPVPPWGGAFRGAFSLPIEDGTMRWDIQLPYGSYESSLGILDNPGMRLDVPKTQRVDRVPSMDGSRTFHALRAITIQPKQRMVFSIHGLPVPPAWPRLARIGVGIAVLVLLGFGAAFVILYARKPDADVATEKSRRKARIEELLDKVAALDRADKSFAGGGEREQLVAELEALYRADQGGEKAA